MNLLIHKKLIYFVYLYFLLATGKILPFDEYNSILHIFVGGLNLLIFLIISIVSIKFRKYFLVGVVILMPVCFLMISSFLFSNNYLYALGKFEGFILVGLFASVISCKLIDKYGLNEFLDGYSKVAILMLLLTFLQRDAQGLYGRDGYFLFNGPIVFGWLMGLAFIYSMYLYVSGRRKIHIFYALSFFLAVVISQSKGPLFAVLVSMVVLIFNGLVRKDNISFIYKLIVFGVILGFGYGYIFDYIISINPRFEAIIRFIRGNLVESDSGSIGVRLDFIYESTELWKKNPLFGVGLGNWGEGVGYDEYRYPHNIFAEIIVEMGIFGLVVLSAFMLIAFFRSPFIVQLSIIYFLICLSFSGDASYWRFLIFFPLALVISKFSKINWIKL